MEINQLRFLTENGAAQAVAFSSEGGTDSCCCFTSIESSASISNLLKRIISNLLYANPDYFDLVILGTGKNKSQLPGAELWLPSVLQ